MTSLASYFKKTTDFSVMKKMCMCSKVSKMMPRGSARTLWATAWSARRIWSSSTSMVTILFMVEHNGMWMKLENKPRMLTRSMTPANTTHGKAREQASGPRSKEGATGRLPECECSSDLTGAGSTAARRAGGRGAGNSSRPKKGMA